MIKFLFLLFLTITLLGIIALRFRRQILTAIEVWEGIKNPKNNERLINKKENPGSVPLIKCAKCEMWITNISAIKLNSNIYFCSRKCMENIIEVK